MNVGIVPAADEDIKDIQAILGHGIRSKLYRGDLAWGENVTDENQLKAIIAGGNLYIVRTEEDIVAVFMLFWDDPTRWGQQPHVAGYLHRFVVAPGLRGQHVGSQIIDLVCQEVAKNGRQYLRLTAPASNKKLQEYHLQNGFVRADDKAHPTHPSQPIAFFERPVSGDIQNEVKTPPKKSFAQRIRNIHFGQRYE